MWLIDLEMACADMHGCMSDVCIDKIVPIVGGLEFYTSDHNCYRWDRETREITLRMHEGWRKHNV